MKFYPLPVLRAAWRRIKRPSARTLVRLIAEHKNPRLIVFHSLPQFRKPKTNQPTNDNNYRQQHGHWPWARQ